MHLRWPLCLRIIGLEHMKGRFLMPRSRLAKGAVARSRRRGWRFVPDKERENSSKEIPPRGVYPHKIPELD